MFIDWCQVGGWGGVAEVHAESRPVTASQSPGAVPSTVWTTAYDGGVGGRHISGSCNQRKECVLTGA